MCRVIAVSNQKGGVGYEKLYIMQSWRHRYLQIKDAGFGCL